MKISLENKHVIISGATHGLGEVTAKLFTELGAYVHALGRDEKRGKELENSLKNLKFYKVDLTNRVEVQSFIRNFESEVSKVDVLINNASRNSRYSVIDIPINEWDDMIALNLTAPFLLSQMAAKLMIKNGVKGKIINVAAIQAHFPLEKSFAYATTKGGLISMTRSMAVDLGKYGIQVITVSPRPIYSKTEKVPEDLDKRAATLLGRMGRMIEFARLLAFLASDLNTFITGEEIIIDGGRIISREPDPEEISTGLV